jgi:ketosteroid isomerase-like protein
LRAFIDLDKLFRTTIIMRKKLIGVAVSSFLISMLIACGPQKEAALVIDKEQIKKEIQEKENRFAELYNTRELKSIGYYADDAISFSQNKAALVGKPAIIEFMKAGLEDTPMGNKITFTTKEVFVSNDGNQVVEIGYYNLADSTNAPINTGNYMVLFEKRDGSYVVVRDMSTSDMPLE